MKNSYSTKQTYKDQTALKMEKNTIGTNDSINVSWEKLSTNIMKTASEVCGKTEISTQQNR